ncbi:MAG: peptidoglycan DD-metalloendopeptidase family protein [Bacilli bacterium]|nr:peptidoglycan DD-metalloendopeptidase family protein [Bacilli bacterium]MDD4607830.1 peptidoglycan DD-metalloendopeptidase family protein [Bacilli bacterium]
MMKKIFNLMAVFVLLVSCAIIPVDNVEAKTLQNLIDELEKTKKEYQANKEKEKLTNQEIANIKSNINNIGVKMQQISNDIINLNDEIETLKVEITNKDKEIKDIINFLQLSNGESAYLEYAFGAQDFTDFIYRVAITEQLSGYNDQLINEFNQMIKDNIQKEKDLKAKDESLKVEQKNLEVQLSKLGNQLAGIYEIEVDLGEAIKQQEEFVKTYKDMGCKLNEDISTCGSQIPKDNAFWRPLATGYVTSKFGPRSFWLNGVLVSDNHHGIDLGANVGTPIYATAKGVVSGVTYHSSCGGNTVYIYHNVNGKNYTSQYMHMYQIYVRVGDVVTKESVIGTVGGASWATPWDGCSTGAHLHFTLLNGQAGKDYFYWSNTFYARAFDPTTKVNFPKNEWWENRTKYYYNHY